MFIKISRRLAPARTGKSGFTLIELLVVIAIIGLLAAILFPVFGRARDNARRSACQSNMKQLGLAMTQYTQDYDETLPKYTFGSGRTPTGTGYDWHDAIFPYVKNVQIYNCPGRAGAGTSHVTSTYYQTATHQTLLSIGGGRQVSYAANRAYFNNAAQPTCVTSGCPNFSQPRVGVHTPFTTTTGTRLSMVPVPAETVLLTEFWMSYIGGAAFLGDDLLGTGAETDEVYRHFGMANILFTDGHVKSMSQGALTTTHDVRATASGTNLIPVAYLFTIQQD